MSDHPSINDVSERERRGLNALFQSVCRRSVRFQQKYVRASGERARVDCILWPNLVLFTLVCLRRHVFALYLPPQRSQFHRVSSISPGLQN